ncbi:MAG: hypothetical protein LBD48_08675 [Treponema sp.]|jgi:tetratricopeptide (TPR) repeat protein|nr:hypothetical protein [Treponema sp.]
MKNFLTMMLIIPLFCYGCQSLRNELFISSPRDQLEMNLIELERMIVTAERPELSRTDQQVKLAAARKMTVDMEKEADADADYAGKLAAWSGRLAILEGRYSEAQRQYRQSRALSADNLPSILLGIRLEGNPEKRLALIEHELALAGPGGSFASGTGELQIEKGRALLDLRRFSEAAAVFDAAFTSGLDSVYIETWQASRDRAWELRYAEAQGGSFEILRRGGITWKDCISLAKTETQLLRFLTAGRDFSEAEIFNRLLERSFIPYTQDVTAAEWPVVKPRIEDPVFRSGAAWFIWHIYAENRADRGLLSKYSARYASGSNPRSPVADLPALSPFFDSILGCVETELLSLPDGRNFRPADPVRGAEILAVLKKMGN